MQVFSCLVTILLCTPKYGKTNVISFLGTVEVSLPPVQNIINVVINNTIWVSILQQQLPQFI